MEKSANVYAHSQCFYPEPDDDFDLEEYLGTWYQVAGTPAPFTSGCSCVQAQYSLNVRIIFPSRSLSVLSACIPNLEYLVCDWRGTADATMQDNGTVNVVNTCTRGDQPIEVQGTATPVDDVYGDDGVFRVEFPAQPSTGEEECPGPNYIVQREYCILRDSFP
jgi:apolipoprotein D and lipocalin family protein